MNENTPPPSGTSEATPPEQPGQGSEAAPEGSPAQPLTAEEVESQWKHRVSQKDRAHAAAEQALRDENETLRRQLQTSRPQSNGQSATGGANDPTVDALRQELEEQRRATEAEKAARVIEQRKAKYPALAREIGDAGNSVFANADEATLARMNARYDDGSSTGTFASATPRRTPPAQQKALGDMTKAEIEAELRRSVERGDLRRPE